MTDEPTSKPWLAWLIIAGVILLALMFGPRVSGPHEGDPCDGSGHHYRPIVIGDAFYLSFEPD